MRRLRRRLVALVGAMLIPMLAGAAGRTPEDTLSAFYKWVLVEQQHKGSSLPSPAQRERLRGYLAPRLIQSLQDASSTEERCIAAARDTGDKPNIFEIDIFVGSWESATEVSFGKLIRKQDSALAEIGLIHIDSRFPKADSRRTLTWTNQVELQKSGSRWLVHDIRFDRETTLASMLAKYVEDGAKLCGR